ncbi:MAG: hypothetical protein IJ729_05565 [Alloprevotella sp.]|nr:hypothetical protein [Alloprevotella sp.]
MVLLYKKVLRKHPRTKLSKYYPVLKSLKLVRQGDVAKLISDETTLNPKEAEMALAQLEKVLVRLLLQGYTVQLGEWASFYVTAPCEGSETEEGCTSALIKCVRAHCRFTPKFREQLKRAEFKLAESLLRKSGKAGGEEGE